MLTPRETEILQLLALGRGNKGAAEVLDISEQTVKNHVSQILQELSCRNMPHAVYKAVSVGILPRMVGEE